MHKFILNIGLARGDDAGLEAGHVLHQLAGVDIHVVAHALHQSDTEATLVVEANAYSDVTHAQIALLSRELGQDCIAVWSPFTNRGALIGPRANAWGEFDPERFLMLDGTRLAP